VCWTLNSNRGVHDIRRLMHWIRERETGSSKTGRVLVGERKREKTCGKRAHGVIKTDECSWGKTEKGDINSGQGSTSKMLNEAIQN